MGQLSEYQCLVVISYCPYVNETKAFACLANRSCHKSLPDRELVLLKRESHCIRLPWSPNDFSSCASAVLTPMGTRLLTDYYRLCGTNIHTALPPGWGGVCTLVSLYEATFVLGGHIDTHHTDHYEDPVV